MKLYPLYNWDYPLALNRYDVIIDDIVSIIWTERFIEAGEVEIVLPVNHEHLKYLAPGTLIGCEESKELMLLETRSIEGDLVKSTGKTIEAFFNNRYLPHKSIFVEGTSVGKAGFILRSIVEYMQHWSDQTKNIWGYDQPFYSVYRLIGNLYTEDPNLNEPGPTYTEVMPNGPVYDLLLSLAKKYNVGQSVLRVERDPSTIEQEGGSTHKMVYTTRHGVDRTDSVIFSTDLDNLADAKQLLSVAGSKNYVTVIPPDWIFSTPIDVDSLRDPHNWIMWNLPDNESRTIFDQRHMTIDCTDLTLEKLDGPTEVGLATQEDYYPALEKMFQIMRSRQEAALIEHKRIKMIDGEITPASKYKYKEDYDLGDKIIVQGEFGDPLTGVITEYIRTQDETGERQYPTVSTDADVVTGSSTPTSV